jgi:hypothetical protein
LPLGIGSRDAMQHFSTFLSPLVANAWIKVQNWKMQPRASQVY